MPSWDIKALSIQASTLFPTFSSYCTYNPMAMQVISVSCFWVKNKKITLSLSSFKELLWLLTSLSLARSLADPGQAQLILAWLLICLQAANRLAGVGWSRMASITCLVVVGWVKESDWASCHLSTSRLVWWHISYLLLRNKLQGKEKQAFTFSVSVGQEFKGHLIGYLWVRASHKATIKESTRVSVISRLKWGRICF